MAGRGPAPKPAAERVRRNKGPQPSGPVAESKPVEGAEFGPSLPDAPTIVVGERVTMSWPDQTRAWWESWRLAPQAKDFTSTDWAFLADTAVLHAAFWLGDRRVADELRLRVAKFGATLEDRARLRIGVTVTAPASGAEPAVKPAANRSTEGRAARILSLVEDAG